MKGEINSTAVMVGNFKTFLFIMDRTTEKKINKTLKGLKNTINKTEIVPLKRLTKLANL